MRIEFELEKTTKGALRYQELKDGEPITVEQGARIGTLYIRKEAIAGRPQRIMVTVEVEA